ncbi:alpha-2-macroglobulin-like protein 1 isoform X2 [Dendropsophus ebraccatus]|uniref:alpha-2-macroglobulin-like protein 1 isoform X2 n=1 Tax=Dendropsophus ebraccatus TaxID=150705 RepID=UPI0038313C40
MSALSLETVLPPWKYNSYFLSKDPNENQIARWQNVSTKRGFADFSFHLANELALGNYKIGIPSAGCVKYFKVDEYVPKRFELNLNIPSDITMTDTAFHLEACGSYTYGKPVEGIIDLLVCAEVCANKWYCTSYSSDEKEPATRNCIDIKGEKTDSNGCVSRDIHLSSFNLSTTEQHYFKIKSKLAEDATGHSEEALADIYPSSARETVQFVDCERYYDKGFPYHGKVKVSDGKNQPVVNESLTLYAVKNDDYSNAPYIKLVTDSHGIARFTLNTSDWPDVLMLKVRPSSDGHNNRGDYGERHYEDSLWLLLFYSKSESLLSIQEHPKDVLCHSDQSVMVEYDIHKKNYRPDMDYLHFFYMLISKSGIFSYKEHKVNIKDQANSPSLRGSFPVNFHVAEDFFPKFGLLVLSVLPSGETIAKSTDYNVSPCAQNKVKLRFSKEQIHLGENVDLEITAEAGSVCSVRMVDKGYLLKNSHADRSLITDMIERLRNSVYKDEYTHLIEDEHRCIGNATPETDNNFDAYKLFLKHNIQILTNTAIKEPVKCVSRTVRSADKMEKTGHKETDKEVQKYIRRSYFPDAWLYVLVSVE